MTDLKIRSACFKDAEEISRMIDELNRQEEMPTGATTPEVLHEHAFSDDPSFYLFVAEGETGLCGYAMICLRIFNSEYAMRGGYLMELWVDEVSRKQGVARELLAAGCALVKKDGGQFMEWFSNIKNDRANTFYENLGARRDELYAHALHPKEFEEMAASGRSFLK